MRYFTGLNEWVKTLTKNYSAPYLVVSQQQSCEYALIPTQPTNCSRHKSILDYLHKVAIAVPKVGSGKLAAAIAHKGKILAVGVNQYKTHPLQAKWKVNRLRDSLHAEIAAIVRGSRILNEDEMRKASIYVARAKKDKGEYVYGLARPCDGCFSCIEAFGFKEVWYTTDDQDIDRIKMN